MDVGFGAWLLPIGLAIRCATWNPPVNGCQSKFFEKSPGDARSVRHGYWSVGFVDILKT